MFVIFGTTTVDLLIRDAEAFLNSGDDGFRASNLYFNREPLLALMGGNGGNTATVLATLGAPVALCSAIGRDHFGQLLAGWLEERGVDTTGLLWREEQVTSTSTILMSPGGRQVVFHHLGATETMRLEPVHERLLPGASTVLISSFPLFPRMRPAAYAQILTRVHERGGVTAVDIGPAIGTPANADELRPYLPQIDYLIANTHELAVCSGLEEWEAAAERLLFLGVLGVIVKRGAAGASFRGSGRRVDVPAFAVEVNNPVGAGDAFNAGFLFGLGREWSLERSLRYGSAAAALVISSPKGTLTAPSRKEVEEFLKTGGSS